MNKLRERIPKRRLNPRLVSRYSEYKDDLREDFNCRCGYCNDEDNWAGGKRFFQIDHFVPRKHMITISEKEYSNLIYSCFFCNNSKRSDWPTNDENLHNNGREGYIDVCHPEYDAQFYRNSRGEIFPRTDLGEYMHKKLKLFLSRHAVIWNLGRLNNQILEIKKIKEEEKNLDLKEKLSNLLSKYFDYKQQLDQCNEE
jgi:hypothetical protein